MVSFYNMREKELSYLPSLSGGHVVQRSRGSMKSIISGIRRSLLYSPVSKNQNHFHECFVWLEPYPLPRYLGAIISCHDGISTLDLSGPNLSSCDLSSVVLTYGVFKKNYASCSPLKTLPSRTLDTMALLQKCPWYELTSE